MCCFLLIISVPIPLTYLFYSSKCLLSIFPPKLKMRFKIAAENILVEQTSALWRLLPNQNIILNIMAIRSPLLQFVSLSIGCFSFKALYDIQMHMFKNKINVSNPSIKAPLSKRHPLFSSQKQITVPIKSKWTPLVSVSNFLLNSTVSPQAINQIFMMLYTYIMMSHSWCFQTEY